MRSPILTASRGASARTPCLGAQEEQQHKAECELIALKLKQEEKTDPNRRKVLERVILPPTWEPQYHHWGVAYPAPSSVEAAICLAKDRFRIHIEGWLNDRVKPAAGWSFCDPSDCNGQIVIATWSRRAPGHTRWGAAPKTSGHENTYWIEYFGPNTGGLIRRSGPFGCTSDPVDHAMSDGRFSEPGTDGGYALMDSDDNLVKIET